MDPQYCYCFFCSLSLSSSEWLDVTMHRYQNRLSFAPSGAQLLKVRVCLLKNNQANPQRVQGGQRDLTEDQGTHSIFLGSSVPVTPRAGQARTLGTLGSLQELSVYFLNT